MRIVAVVVGSLLLVGGAAVVVAADQQRAAALDGARQEVARLQERLDDAQEANLRLAGTLTGLRTRIAEQDAQLSDTTGLPE